MDFYNFIVLVFQNEEAYINTTNYSNSFNWTNFEITNGQSMCMIGKGKGQDATINPYADEDYSYALIENIGSVEFQIRVEKQQKRF